MNWWLFAVACAQCFDDAVAPADRSNITVDGISVPFTIGFGDWVSARVVATALQIFLEEKLGFNVVISPKCGTSCVADELRV